MSDVTKLQVELSELREEANKESTSDERRKEIRTRMVELEPKLRQALEAQEQRVSEPVQGLSDRC